MVRKMVPEVENKIMVLNPTAKGKIRKREIASRLDNLSGKVIGFLDNGKPNSDLFLAHIKEALSMEFRLSDLLEKAKTTYPYGGGPASEDIYHGLASSCQGVIVAMGD